MAQTRQPTYQGEIIKMKDSELRNDFYDFLHKKILDGKTFFKSKEVRQLMLEELGIEISPKQCGNFFAELMSEENGLHVEKWGYSKSTTWKVELN